MTQIRQMTTDLLFNIVRVAHQFLPQKGLASIDKNVTFANQF